MTVQVKHRFEAFPTLKTFWIEILEARTIPTRIRIGDLARPLKHPQNLPQRKNLTSIFFRFIDVSESAHHHAQVDLAKLSQSDN